MTISADTPFTVNADGSGGDEISASMLDSNNVIVMYDDNTDYSTRIVQDDETLGTEFTIDALGFVTHDLAISALSSTKAICIREGSGDGDGAIARILVVSGTTITAPGADNEFSGSGLGGYSVVALSSTAAIATATLPLGRAYYLTVSGNTITSESNVAFETGSTFDRIALCKLSSTKAVVVYTDDGDGSQLKAVVLSVSGVTISAGSPSTIDAGDDCTLPAVAEISSTSCLVTYRNTTDGDIKAVVLSGMSATSVTVNTPIIVDSNDGTTISLSAYSATQFVTAYRRASGNSGRFIELAVSGVTVSTVGVNDEYDTGVADGGGFAAAYSATQVIHVYKSSTEAVMLTLSADTLSLAAMTKPADIDAAGTFIYVALLEGGFPILTKISTALNADGTTVFNPGAGDNIGVECGRFSSDTVWVAGNFDGTNVVEKSEDAGDSFTVKDDSVFGDIRSFVMGSDSDERVLVFDETNGDILETIDNGAIWTTINSAVTPEINAIARLGENVQESVFGNDGGANNSINYSVNSGDDLEDFQTGVYPNANATRVIIN
jgi:hypothetical protein